MEASYQAECARFAAVGQEQVFRFWDKLSVEDQTKLLKEAQRVDLDSVARGWKSCQAAEASAHAAVNADTILPFKNIVDAASADETLRNQWREAGLKLVARGEAATILMAGGAGTRLGFEHPKGMYDVHLPSHKSLFQVQAERLLSIRASAAKQEQVAVESVHVPYYIMTSDGTHEETVAFWRQHNFFGIPEADVFFFQQGMLPALDFQGKILLESMHGISWAANGNGGLYEALHHSGALDDMQRRGVKYVDVFCVDNILVRVTDPWMLGFCAANQIDCCNKTVEKINPKEGVGVMCLRAGADGKAAASVIEYSEIPAELAAKVDDDMKADEQGRPRLVFRAANIAIHCFSLKFLQICAERRNDLPFHIAKKKIPSTNDDGATVTPAKENGIKMEMFVFDVFPFADCAWAFQVRRDEDFSPVKNAPGAAACTRDTARADVTALHTRWLKAAGAEIVVNAADPSVEISPLVSYGGEGLESLKGRTFETPVHLQQL